LFIIGIFLGYSVFALHSAESLNKSCIFLRSLPIFQDPILSSISVDPTPHICVPSMLLLLSVGN
jgi:hypothetical protein